jgi:hypothetical protein
MLRMRVFIEMWFVMFINVNEKTSNIKVLSNHIHFKIYLVNNLLTARIITNKVNSIYCALRVSMQCTQNMYIIQFVISLFREKPSSVKCCLNN